MEVNRAVIIHTSDDTKWVIEREFDNNVRLELHRYNRSMELWSCNTWVTFDAATWDRIVAAMADSATEVIPHG